MAIHLGRPSPDASRNRPGRRRGNPPAERSRHAAPIWFCSRWGLPCHHRFRRRGALLPHPFTLTRRRLSFGGRFTFCGTFPGVAPAGRYPAPCLHGARTFLPRTQKGTKATIRPSGRGNIGLIGIEEKPADSSTDQLAKSGDTASRFSVYAPAHPAWPKMPLKGTHGDLKFTHIVADFSQHL